MLSKVLAALLAASPLVAHVVVTTRITWTREVSRIVQKRCLSCHREGGSAPFALETYAQARPWAKAIQEEVLERRMPPWGAVKGFGEFANDAGLTQEEINLIAEWAEGGAPEGDPALLPPPAPAKRSPVAAPPRGSPITVRGSLTVKTPVTVLAVRPLSDSRVVAHLPDGSIEPLVWVPGFNAKSAQTYWLRKPLRIVAGGRIEGVATVFVQPR